MSTATVEPGSIDVSQGRKVPFSRLVGVELRKSYDTRSGFWLLASMGILTVIVLVIMLIVAAVNDTVTFEYGDFVGGVAFVTSILLPVLGILLVTSEWSQRTAMTTFTLAPHRGEVIMAKLVTGLVLTLGVALFAIVAGTVANVLYGVIVGDPSWNFGFNFFIGFLITQSLAMLGGFALAALFLNSPAAIVAFFAYKWVLPTIFAIAAELMNWFDKLLPWIDFQTAQTPVYDLTVVGKDWAHLLVSGAVWLALPLGIGLWRVLRAEVK
jgi:ABC-2 type transport system permease protein